MIRWIGIGLMIMGATAFGLAMSRELEKRLIQLREIKKMVSMLKGEIRCANSTLAEGFYHVAERIMPPFSEFLRNMAAHMEEFRGDTIQEIFREHVDTDLKESALLAEDLEQLGRLGDQLGYLDLQMQINAMEHYESQLDDAYEQAAQAFGNKSKMYRYLGLMGGLFLAIIFI